MVSQSDCDKSDYSDTTGTLVAGAATAVQGEEDCPTPSEIRERCEAIRSQWTEHEHWKRAGFSRGKPPWLPKTVSISVPAEELMQD